MKVCSPSLLSLPCLIRISKFSAEFLSPSISGASIPTISSEISQHLSLNSQRSHPSVKRLDIQSLQDRQIALNFQRENIRKSKQTAQIYTVNQGDDDWIDEDEEVQEEEGNARKGGEMWRKLKKAEKKVTALDALRRR